MKPKITGFKELRAKMKNQKRKYLKAVDDAVLITAIQVQKTAVESILKTSLGREYSKGGGVTHIASKAGDAPNSDEGVLVGSINISHRKGSGIARIGSHEDYAVYLELMKDRPFLVPALKKNKKNLKKNIEARVRMVTV